MDVRLNRNIAPNHGSSPSRNVDYKLSRGSLQCSIYTACGFVVNINWKFILVRPFEIDVMQKGSLQIMASFDLEQHQQQHEHGFHDDLVDTDGQEDGPLVLCL